MDCLIETVGSYTIIEVKSDLLTVSDYLSFSRKASSIIDEGSNNIAIHFPKDILITASFLGFLIEIVRKVRRIDGDIVVIPENDDQVELLKMAHIDKLVRLFNSKQAFTASQQ